jgi:hypothetical protein
MSLKKNFVGDWGRVAYRYDLKQDISDATDQFFLIQKPDGTVIQKTATLVNNHYLVYIIEEGVWNQAGKYTVQGEVLFVDGALHVPEQSHMVYESLVVT